MIFHYLNIYKLSLEVCPGEDPTLDMRRSRKGADAQATCRRATAGKKGVAAPAATP